MQLDKLTKEIFKEKFPPRKVLFRVDAGRISGLSFGHLSRCLILAKELKRGGTSQALFLMRNYKEGVDYAKSNGCMLKTISTSLPKNRYNVLIKEWLSREKPDYLVVDLPDEDPNSYLTYAKRNKILTVCIDDVGKRSYHCDTLLNSSILADRNCYKSCLPATRFLLGIDYFIMSNHFVRKPKVISDTKIRILVTLGGSDPLGLTRNVVSALVESAWSNVKFTVILGPGFKDKNHIINASKSFHNKITIIDCPRDIQKNFLKNDFVICAGGRTLYELYKIGMPFFAIASNQNEAMVIEKFLEKGMLKFGLLKWDKQLFLEKLESVIFKRMP